jgi:hypothetical protein
LHDGFPGRQRKQPGSDEEVDMLEYLITSANILGLAGCFGAAYAIARACSARAHTARKNLPRDYADHELFFRRPCADYYI